MSGNKRLFALRGACCCLNDEADIQRQVSALYDELLKGNGLDETGLVSVIFSMTADLNALNAAAALRRQGRAAEAALFVTQEAAVKNSLPRTVRVLIHCYLDENAVPVHVYRNGAEVLRPDRTRAAEGGGGAEIAFVCSPEFGN
jgi:chorismate mutase